MAFEAQKVLCFSVTLTSARRYKSLSEVFSWKTFEYGFPSVADHQYATDNGLMINNTGTTIDVDVHYKKNGDIRVFATTPRFSAGIPFTLGLVSKRNGPNGPIVEAYPSYDIQKSSSDCSGIISAFRTRIDECDQFWVLDSGNVANSQVCPPQVHIIDLNTNKITKSFKIPNNVYTPGVPFLANLFVDIRDPPPRGKCQKAMVYITDVANHGLVVFDSDLNEVWRIENKLLYPDPDWGTHTIAGVSFTQIEAPFAVNVSPRGIGGDRYLYFHSLAGQTQNRVPLRVVDNRAIWQANPRAKVNDFEEIGKRGVQVSAAAMDSRGNLYGITNDPLTLIAWNINTPYTQEFFKPVANNPEQLQYGSGMKIIKNPNGYEELWVTTNRLEKILTGTQNPQETNYRILTCRTDDRLKGRDCGKNDLKLKRRVRQ